MKNETKPKHFERRCSNCGSRFMSNFDRAKVTCPDCKQLLEDLKRRSYTRSVLIGYRVVYDPDPEYGYSVGASFPREEVNQMLSLRYLSFNPGTIIRDNYGHEFLIVFEPNGRLKKVPCQKERTAIKN